MVGYEWKAGGTKQVAYVGVDGHVHELYVQVGKEWLVNDLTKIAGAPRALGFEILGGSIAGYEWGAGQSKQVVFLSDADHHIHELYCQLGGDWALAHLTDITGAPPYNVSS